MGDISSEPSMEEILSSIKRIIAEEGDAAVTARTRRSGGRGSLARTSQPIEVDEILELSQPVDQDAVEAPEPEPRAEPAVEQPMAMGSPTPSAPEGKRVFIEDIESVTKPEPTDPILSPRAAEATRGRLEALSRMVVRPEVSGTDTLEGMVRDMLKPMLSEWLDANLPSIVESMVAREISRITGRQ